MGMELSTAKLKGYLMILVFAICFSSYGVWSRFLGPEFGVFYQCWVRSLISLMILLPISFFGNHLKRVKKSGQK